MINRRNVVYLITIAALLVVMILSLTIPAMSNTVNVADTPDVNGTVNARLTEAAALANAERTATAIIGTVVGQAITATAESRATLEKGVGVLLNETARAAGTLERLGINLTLTAIPERTKAEATNAAYTATAQNEGRATEAIVRLTWTAQAGLDKAAQTATAEGMATAAVNATISAGATAFAEIQDKLANAASLNPANAMALSQITTLRHNGPVAAMDVSPDDLRVAAAHESIVLVWDIRLGSPTLRLVHSAPVTHVYYAPNGEHLITITDSGVVWLWDAVTGELGEATKGHTGTIFDLAFSPDGSLFATAGADRTVVWDARTGKALLPLPSGWAYHVEFSASGRFVITAGGDGAVRVWGVPKR
ncbi:MAG TPA: hypothetical protein PLD47_17560 [Aggregatilineales bacterium]|nr:hypothetical protein [Aggregatilineales bacterium]